MRWLCSGNAEHAKPRFIQFPPRAHLNASLELKILSPFHDPALFAPPSPRIQVLSDSSLDLSSRVLAGFKYLYNERVQAKAQLDLFMSYIGWHNHKHAGGHHPDDLKTKHILQRLVSYLPTPRRGDVNKPLAQLKLLRSGHAALELL